MPDPDPRARSAARPAALAGLALVACAAWLLVPRATPAAEPTRAALRAVLIDASASVVRTRSGWAGWVRRTLAGECAAAEAAGEELLVVEFAADVRVVHGPASAAAFHARLEGRAGPPLRPGSGGRDLATRLAGALRVASDALLAPDRASGRVTIVSDRTWTGEDPASWLALLAARATPVDWIEPPASDLPDLAILALRAPDRLERGTPLAVAVDLAWTPPAAGSGPVELALAYRAEGPGEPRTGRVAIAPPPGEADAARAGPQQWTERIDLGELEEGRHFVRVVAEVRAAGRRDPIPENDERALRVRVGDPLVCVAVAPAQERAALAAHFAGPAFDGLQMLWTGPEGASSLLADADLLLSIDVGPLDLPPGAAERLVAEGGGWVACGGWGFLRGWRSAGGDLLPLRPAPEGDDPRDVVLLVDGSGSMAGEPFERVRAACLGLALAAFESDRVVLRFFTGTLGPVVFSLRGGSAAARRRALEPLLAASVPRGPTDILYALEQLADTRDEDGPPAFVLLLTDGRTQDWHPSRSREVRRRLAAARADLRIITVGERPEREFLGSLLLEGETLVDAGDLTGLEDVLQREVNEGRVREGGPVALVPRGGSARTAGGVAADVLDGQLAGATLGTVERYARARLVPGAELLWSSAEGDPVLALQPVGRGLVACCATRPGGGWCSLLDERPEVLAPLLVALGRGRREAVPTLALRLEAQELRLTGAPADWPALVQATFHRPAPGSLWPVGLEERGTFAGESTLTPPAVAAPGALERTAERPAFLDGVPAGEVLGVELSSAGRTLGQLFLVAPGPLEVARGGRPVPTSPASEPPRPPDPVRRRAHPAAPPLLLAGLLGLALAGLLRAGGGQGMGRFRRR